MLTFELGLIFQNPEERYSEIIMYTHQAVNLYYYKLTVDGVNVILVSILSIACECAYVRVCVHACVHVYFSLLFDPCHSIISAFVISIPTVTVIEQSFTLKKILIWMTSWHVSTSLSSKLPVTNAASANQNITDTSLKSGGQVWLTSYSTATE